MASGLDNFLVVGDCYRRDEIDASHYPVFHQVEAVRLLDRDGFCRRWPRLCSELDDSFRLFEDGERSEEKQAFHTEKVVRLLEEEMKDCLVGLIQHLFGKGASPKFIFRFLINLP